MKNSKKIILITLVAILVIGGALTRKRVEI